MKIIIIFLTFFLTVIAQQTVTDYDGNIYKTMIIGEQIWLKENLKSLHYSDGTPVPDVVAYNNDDSLGIIYGLLYTWSAAMKGSNQPGDQGVCPCDWHVPTDEEWTVLENYLGGASIAGGKMKEAGSEHWMPPNTGATNSSGFTGLPAGEFDAYFNPNKFWLLHTAAVFWTSTQTNQSQALERYLSHDDVVCGRLAWYKVMKYSIRCVKDLPSDTESESKNLFRFQLNQNYPNPFNPSTKIKYQIPDLPAGRHRLDFVTIQVYNVLGNLIAVLVDEEKTAGIYEVEFDATGLPSGIYLYQLKVGNYMQTKKMMVIK